MRPRISGTGAEAAAMNQMTLLALKKCLSLIGFDNEHP
jgi:hypothetical protein